MSRKIVIKDPNETVLIKELEKRNDIKAERIKRLLKLPDLTKKENSPVKILFFSIKFFIASLIISAFSMLRIKIFFPESFLIITVPQFASFSKMLCLEIIDLILLIGREF